VTSLHNNDIESKIMKGMMFGGVENESERSEKMKKKKKNGNGSGLIGGYDSQDEQSSVGDISDNSDNDSDLHHDQQQQQQQQNKKKRSNKDDEKGMKLLVCPNFIDGTCTSTGCLLAHPGLRDNAQIFIKATRNEDGSRKRIPYVYICPMTDGADLMMCRVSKLSEPIALGPDSTVPKKKVIKQKDKDKDKEKDKDKDKDKESLPEIPQVETSSGSHRTIANKRHANTKPPIAPKEEESKEEEEEIPERYRYKHICSLGKQCTSYHVYVRPSTTDIILAMYPIRCGHRTQIYPNGSKLIGNVRDDKFNGYGTMIWENGDIYMGDWKENQRHGFGIYRNKDGSMEYIGQFAYGVRSGWGLLRTKNGDEYVGQWANGKMHGVGILISISLDPMYQPGQSKQQLKALQIEGYDPDSEFKPQAFVGKTVYHGEFKEDLYDGIGLFQRSNGDVYMGYCQAGKAHGLGVLSLSSGEKYKGYFDRNARHGRGCCAYPNGARYAGHWYRGVHSGYGIFISPEGEKYIGEWDGGKKHGKGRYLFKNHDFYDGEFVKNKAKGVGVYVHANGNLYTGQWVSVFHIL
jgi:hypothetical protein